MRDSLRFLASALMAALGVFAAGAVGRAETCKLELKRLESAEPGRRMAPNDWVYRSVSSQHFFMQVGRGITSQSAGNFSQVITKEPAKYQAEHPFRGVAKLGADQYGFVLDSQGEKSKGYDRLYFDLNHNGDLTDDKPIDAAKPPAGMVFGGDYSQHQFPRVDVKINVDGKPLEYAFSFQVYSSGSKEFRYASASLMAAACRVGEITLDGKKHQVAVVDYNSNGRFDDVVTIPDNVRGMDGQVYPTYGDMLMIDPEKPMTVTGPIATVEDESRQYVSKLAKVDGRFYDVKVTAAGDELTLTPSPAALGKLVNPNAAFTATIHGDQGFLNIKGDKENPAVVPEGQWNLVSYAIQVKDWKEPPPAPKKEPAKKEAAKKPQSSLLQTLSRAILGTSVSADTEARYGPPGYTMISAQGTRDTPPVTVRSGQTATLAFGPPYKPVVKAQAFAPGMRQVDLSMSLVGSGGEIVGNLVVDGKRPPKPEFTITNAKGETVQTGSFEYG